ncbi:hypothetical protein PL8927_330044 [Planktothrix serta PCC 8927]|uniref:Uncharacterized protein n=1 Tax=Planktothrix serta PCC 8927 TaxID=671068 RepID=A0A7Z9BKU5_9CYAN|nr:hypothetical protein [Planktothrix serta]VXD14916.1 hypothetical protein PL8927_330044 [Planktothrix serta PCC 8927]
MKLNIAITFLSLIFIGLTRSELIQATPENHLSYPLTQQTTAQETSPINCGNPQGCIEDSPRNPEDKNTPTIVNPENYSTLEGDRPEFSWYTVEGATTYIVRLVYSGSSEGIGERTITAKTVTPDAKGVITIPYPFNTALQPGREYKLTVETDVPNSKVGLTVFKVRSP